VRLPVALLATLAAGCGARGELPPDGPPVPDTRAVLPQPADSMVLTAPGGVSVWLTEGRRASDSAGTACYERSIEIRRDTSRLKVPLLYTVTVPVLLDDSSFKAELARDCRPTTSYRVGLRDGMPHKITP
jgi:hypothetical protein